MYVYLCTTSMPGTFGGQERTLGLLKLELQVSCDLPCGCWRIKPSSSGRAASALKSTGLNLHS